MTKDLVDSQGNPDLFLRNRLTRAMESAMPEKEYHRKRQVEVDLTTAHLSGDLTLDEYREKMRALASTDGQVEFDTIMDFKKALSLLFRDEDNINNVVAHENDHMNMAQRRGFVAKYALRFFKRSDGSLGIEPSVVVVNIHRRESLSEDQIRRHVVEITEAPEILSAGDREVLNSRRPRPESDIS